MLINSSTLGITCFLLLFIIIVTIVSIINVMYKMVIKVYDVTNLSLSLRPDIDSSVSYLDDEKIRDCLFQSGEWSIVASCQEHFSCEYGIIRGEVIYQDRLSYHSFLL